MDAFIFMGADGAHHGGQLRPSVFRPLPKHIKPSPYIAKYPSICPSHIFKAVHPQHKGSDPFYKINDGIAYFREQADHTCTSMQEFDAADNVFVIIAHDPSLLDPKVGIELFPQGTLKDWKAKDYAR